MTSPRPASLWRHHDFRQLWAAETISQLGTHITLLALPVLAVLVTMFYWLWRVRVRRSFRGMVGVRASQAV